MDIGTLGLQRYRLLKLHDRFGKLFLPGERIGQNQENFDFIRANAQGLPVVFNRFVELVLLPQPNPRYCGLSTRVS